MTSKCQENVKSSVKNLHLYALPSGPLKRVRWRQTGIGVLCIIFGLVWGIDAWFKWQPDFQQNFASYLTGTLNGQPPAIHTWITFWSQVVNTSPFLFAHLEALGETALAIGLIFGIFSNVTNVGGLLLSLMIWSTAEGFGGPYAPWFYGHRNGNHLRHRLCRIVSHLCRALARSRSIPHATARTLCVPGFWFNQGEAQRKERNLPAESRMLKCSRVNTPFVVVPPSHTTPVNTSLVA